MKQYRFRKMTKEEIPSMFTLIKERIEWMDQIGIQQWNVTDYLDVYPIAYYENHYENGDLFGLYDKENNLVCAAALQKNDFRWEQDTNYAFYIHHLVSKLGMKNVGKIFIKEAELYALSQNKTYMRLDSAIDNESLTKYYESLGYLDVGKCIDGLYYGILREKRLDIDIS